MNKDAQEAWVRLLVRSIIALPFWVLWIYLWTNPSGGSMLGAFPGLIFGAASLLVGVIIIASPLAELIGNPAGSIYYSESRFDRPLPQYSMAEAIVKKGNYEEAFSLYASIAEEYPGTARPYIGMIEVAVLHLGDLDRAEQVYQTGMQALVKQVEEQDTLTRMYEGIRTRIEYARPTKANRTIKMPDYSSRKQGSN